MKIQLLFILMIVICVSGCGDEGVFVENPFLEEDIPAAPYRVQVTDVPPKVQKLLWGDMEALLKELSDVLDDGVFEAEVDGVRVPVHDTAGSHKRYLLDKICKINQQQAYYTKYINAGGIAVMGHRLVNDRHFYAAREMVLKITSKRPEIRQPLLPKHGFRMILMGGDNRWNFLIPEVSVTSNTYTGLGWCAGLDYCAAHVWIHPDKDEITGMGVFVHEFGHAMHKAIQELDPTFQSRLEAAYTQGLETGSYWGHGAYELENVNEYWAGGVEEWFMDLSHPDILEWRARFIETDPLLHALLEEWFHFIYLAPIQWKW